MSNRNIVTGTIILMVFILVAGITIINMHNETRPPQYKLTMRDASGAVMLEQLGDKCYVSSNGGNGTVMSWSKVLLDVGKPLNGSLVCERLP